MVLRSCLMLVRANVVMPIVAAVDDLLAGRADVDAVLERLLSRPLRPERA